jgi:hypothetical protein
MNRRNAAVLLTTWLCLASVTTYGQAATDVPKEPVPLGTMTAFWRHRPVVDRWLVGELGFTRVPDYLCNPALSFPYRRKPTPREIPFADHVAVVRLLGGWNRNWENGEVAKGQPVDAYDLAFRNDQGEIRYRWHLLRPRLDPYAKGGYGLTIVLDNTPWCFRSKEGKGSYGNADPPTDFGEWGAFIEELCRQLVSLYGRETVSQWRFRMGTECQGKDRFTGTQEEFHKLYDHAATAVKRVLPDAKFGPFNLAGNPDGPNVSFHALVEHCLNETNHATGKVGSPLDFASVSAYTSPSLLRAILRTTHPQFKAQQKIDFWDRLGKKWPQLARISREVHEFGVLGNEFKLGSGEPGARGAAWTFHVMMALREGGLDRLWSWGGLEPINLGGKHQVLNGTGWVFSILEHTVGGETYSLQPTLGPVVQEMTALSGDLKAIATFERPGKLARPGKLFAKSIAVVHKDRTFVITSAYHEDRFVTTPVDVTITLPKSLLPTAGTPRVRYAALTRTGAVHCRIRQDLADAGLLDAKFAAVPGLLSGVKAMGGRPAWKHVDTNWPRYEGIVHDSLVLKPFEGRMEPAGDGQRITFRMAPPSVMVIVLDGRDD